MSDEQAIRDAIERWMTATREGDADTVLGLMTDDVVFMTPGRAPFGKAEFAAQSKAMQGVEIDGRSEVLEVRVAGAFAWTRAHITITVNAPGGKSARRAGHVLSVWQKGADGRWRILRDANLVVPE
jgi:uncharacterized protein (TIGR02246 family)